MPKTPIIELAGDIVIDWVMAPEANAASHTVQRFRNPRHAFSQASGVLLLKRLLESLSVDNSDQDERIFTVRGPQLKSTALADTTLSRSYALLRKYQDDGKVAWRVSKSLGLDRPEDPDKTACASGYTAKKSSNIVVLYDSGLGFSDWPECWPVGIADDDATAPDWTLLKMGGEIATGRLWRRLTGSIDQGKSDLISKLIVITTVDHLRDAGAEISRDLSWERSALDCVAELRRNRDLNSLLQCYAVIISFGPTGALLVTQREDNPLQPCTLFFHSELMEGAWEEAHPESKSGSMFGYNMALTAHLARSLAEGLGSSGPDLATGIKSGLTAMERVYDRGFTLEDHRQLEFPVWEATRYATVSKKLQQAKIPTLKELSRDESSTSFGSSILSETYRKSGVERLNDDAVRVALHHDAVQVALHGPSELKNVPYCTFGTLHVVNRREIESLRAIRNLIKEYCAHSEDKEPLAIGVFGSPGSGKGYVVDQLRKSLEGMDIKQAKFNLSQFASIDGLIGALHQVRDLVLKEETPPLVLWDEFDTSFGAAELGWLRYFLAPVQDGFFQQGEVSHHIGRAIFVFAGGRFERHKEFSAEVNTDYGKKVKGPDFLSRLRGYIDILGPDPEGDSIVDPYYVIRRALTLYGLFNKEGVSRTPKRDGGFDIDEGVLDAFLQVPNYRHGVRSIQAILQMSRIEEGQTFGRSALPAQAQLNLHVNGSRFLELTRAKKEGAAPRPSEASLHETTGLPDAIGGEN